MRKKNTKQKQKQKISKPQQIVNKYHTDKDVIISEKFDYNILNINEKNVDIHSVNNWIIFSIFIFLFIQTYFLSKTFQITINSLFSHIDKEVVLEFFYYLGFLGSILISLDIYEIKSLKKFDLNLLKNLRNYYNSLLYSIKYSITITDRDTSETVVWYRNSLFIFILLYKNDLMHLSFYQMLIYPY